MAQKAVEGRSAGQRSRPSEDVVCSTDNSNIAPHRHTANALTAVMDREGVVIAVVASRVQARAFLRGGCA
ncbi:MULTISPECIES: hypothetical protein [unclassified Methylobacterium]|uniref:hypothetical protein n=1 Tax=unclassified Methylobacterium TaxID=2615210 RepID=UPI0022697E1E|nr:MULTISPECIES: hypothetical protein [unclassified Methylobacterium]